MLFGADGALWKRRLGHGLVKFGPGLKGGSPAASRVFLSKFGENFVRGFSNHLAAANLAKALAQLGLPSRFYFLVSALVERMEQKLGKLLPVLGGELGELHFQLFGGFTHRFGPPIQPLLD